MVTQQVIYELMQNNRESPEITEAAYLAAKYLNTEQIDRNHRLRYGSGQGFVKFKEQIIEGTEYDAVISEHSRHGAQIRFRTNTDDDALRLDDIVVEDVHVNLDKVVQDAFEDKIAGQLREELVNNFPALTHNALVLAYLLRRGYDLGTWADRTEPDTETLWQLYTIVTGETPTNPMKKDLIEELVHQGCIYVNNNDIILSPGFTEFEDPYEHLPQVEITSSQ